MTEHDGSRRRSGIQLLLVAGPIALAACGSGPAAGPASPPAATTGTLIVRVSDDGSRGLVEGAAVLVEPGGLSATTDDNGEARFPGLADGAYGVTASAPGLRLSGHRIVPGGRAEARATGVSVVVGASAELRLRLPRIDETINLVALHAGAIPQPPGYSDDNCIACHGSRRNERSNDPALPAFHAIATREVLPKGRGGCVFCHPTVDLAASSGATLGKQVDVEGVCTQCHWSYPASFQVGAAAP